MLLQDKIPKTHVVVLVLPLRSIDWEGLQDYTCLTIIYKNTSGRTLPFLVELQILQGKSLAVQYKRALLFASRHPLAI